MRYIISDTGEGMEAGSPEELVRLLHRGSRAPARDDAHWMAEASERYLLQTGLRVRHDTAVRFISDLIHHGMIRVEN